MLTLGDLVATIVTCNHELCLAIVRVTDILQSRHHHHSIAEASLFEENSKTELTGQILQLKADEKNWTWMGLVETVSTQNEDAVIGRNHAIIRIPPGLAQPVNPNICTGDNDSETCDAPTTSFCLWTFAEEQLQILFDSLCGQPDILKRAPSFQTASTLFPYQSIDGMFKPRIRSVLTTA